MNRIALLFGILVMISVACGKSVIKRETQTDQTTYEQCFEQCKKEKGCCCDNWETCLAVCREICKNQTEQEPEKRAVREVAPVEQEQSEPDQTDVETCFDECTEECECEKCISLCREKCESETGGEPKERAMREAAKVEQEQPETNQEAYEKCFEQCKKDKGCCCDNWATCTAECKQICENETGGQSPYPPVISPLPTTYSPPPAPLVGQQ